VGWWSVVGGGGRDGEPYDGKRTEREGEAGPGRIGRGGRVEQDRGGRGREKKNWLDGVRGFDEQETLDFE
jgi:hypothetical protein